jgi:hypothetical protein
VQARSDAGSVSSFVFSDDSKEEEEEEEEELTNSPASGSPNTNYLFQTHSSMSPLTAPGKNNRTVPAPHGNTPLGISCNKPHSTEEKG